MEEISAAIGNILGDPAKLEQLRQAAQSLGLAPPEGQQAPASGGENGQADPSLQEPSASAQEPAPTLEEAAYQAPGTSDTLQKLSQLLQECTRPDQNEALLRTLRPYFSPQRASRVDDAIRIMQLCRLWPALRESGLLGELGTLLKGGKRQ